MKRVFWVIGTTFFSALLLNSYLTCTQQIVLMATSLLLFFISVIFCRKKASVCICLLCISLSTASYLAKEMWQYQPVVAYAETVQPVTAQIRSKVQRDNGNYRYVMRTQTIGTDQIATDLTVFLTDHLDADIGDVVTLPLTLQLPNSTTFDLLRYYKASHNYLVGFGLAEEATVQSTTTKDPVLSIHKINQYLASRLDETLSTEVSGVLKSMILGDRADLDDTLSNRYRSAGSYHLFAVSGLHLSILVGVFLFLFQPLGLRMRCVACLPIIVFFVLLSGAHLSTLRSALMVSVFLFGQCIYQRVDGLNSLGLAAFLILLLDPYAILDTGFLLSVAATFGIVFLYPKTVALLQKFPKLNRAPYRYFTRSLLFSVAVTLPLLPFYVFTFGTVSLMTPLSNLMLVPLATPVLILGFLSCILLCFCTPTPLLLTVSFLVQVQNKLADLLGRVRFATIGLDYPIFSYVVVAVLLLLFCSALFRVVFYKRVLQLCSVCICLVSLLVTIALPYQSTVLYVIGDGNQSNLIFVYQGSCTVVSTADDTYIDTQTLQFLQQKGIRQIDNLILSYQGFSTYQDTVTLLETIPVQKVFYHEKNLLCKSVLENAFPAMQILPITNTLFIQHPTFTLNAAYHNGGLYFTTSVRDIPIFIGNTSAGMSQTAALYFYKSISENSVLQDDSISYLLHRPYDDALSKLPTPTYQGILTISFASDGSMTVKQS